MDGTWLLARTFGFAAAAVVLTAGGCTSEDAPNPGGGADTTSTGEMPSGTSGLASPTGGTNSSTTSGAMTTTGMGTTGTTGLPTSGTGVGTSGAGTTGMGTTGVSTTGTGVSTTSDGGAPQAEGGVEPGSEGACTPAPPGMFEVTTETGTGPDGNYTIVRPATLGEGGFLHPPVAWGNGLATTPDLYAELLENVASNGFVVIANPGTGSDPQVVRAGLEWLLQQNGSGDYAGKLAVDCAGTIGYSMGGGAAVGSGSHPAVKAIVSIHGLQDNSAAASGPILLTTSDDDGFVTPEGFVQPCYDASSVQPTILAKHITGNAGSFNGHLEPLGDGGADAEPGIAWLRYWIYGDQSQRDWFFGPNCKVCGSGWDVQRKNHAWE